MIEKFQKLSSYFSKYGIDGYLMGTTDEFQSEYPSPGYRRLEYITNFSSTNAYLLIFKDKFYFFTDSRYITAAKESGLNPYNISEIPGIKFEDGVKIGFNPKLFSKSQIKLFEKLDLVEVSEDLVDNIWDSRPVISESQIYEYDIKYAGESLESKIEKIRNILKEKNISSALISSSESVCWLLNIRSENDSDFSPVLLSKAYIDFDRVVLFANLAESDSGNYEVRHISSLENFLNKIDKKILVPKDSNISTFSSIRQDLIYEDQDPILILKAQKNQAEIDGAKNAHIEDAIALCEFFGWLENNHHDQTEYSLSLKLTEFRKNSSLYKKDSFPSIVGMNSNGAKIHYRPDSNSSAKIENGILLIDSGGHYFGGTTDVTRTISIGEAKNEHREYYTKVLKGHIALAKIKFPKKITGAHLDVLARQYLWDNSEDYMHGTGHGVGNFLSVHEHPPVIGLGSFNQPLLPGMIVSNEPGYYSEGKFGIRIENLQFVKKSSHHDEFYEFEQLTLAPYCKSLILFDRISSDELGYLESYTENIEKYIEPHLSKLAKDYLLKNKI